MKIRKLVSVLSLSFMLIWSAQAGEKVAVLDFQSIIASEELGMAVAEILRTELVGLGDYTLIERGMLEQLVKEQELQLSGAIDSETAVEIGKLAGAKLVVTGSIVKTGSVYTINARFVDVETGIAKVGQNIRGQGEDEISNMVHQLALIITGKTVVTEDIIERTATPEPVKSELPHAGETQSLLVFSFENQQELQQWDAEAGDSGSRMEQSSQHATDGRHSLHIRLEPYDNWQGIRTDSLPPDWSMHRILAFDVFYEASSPDFPLPILIRVDDDRTSRLKRDWFMKPYILREGSATIRVYIEDIGTRIDLRKIITLMITTNKLKRAADVYVDNFRFEDVFPPAPTEPFRISFETPVESLVNWQPNGRMIRFQSVKEHVTHGEFTLKIGLPRKLPANDYPGIVSQTFPRDWSNYHTLSADVYFESKGRAEIMLGLRIDDAASTSQETRFLWNTVLQRGENTLQISVDEIRQAIDVSKIREVHLFLDQPQHGTTIYLDNVMLE